MSKNLEKEYKQMMEDMCPDLWDRIEAGVNASPRANNVLTFDGVVKAKKEDERPSKIRNFYQYRAYAGVAACFILLMIAIPTVHSSMIREKQDAEVAIVMDGTESAESVQSVTGRGFFTTEGTVFDEAKPELAASSEEAVAEEAVAEETGAFATTAKTNKITENTSNTAVAVVSADADEVTEEADIVSEEASEEASGDVESAEQMEETAASDEANEETTEADAPKNPDQTGSKNTEQKPDQKQNPKGEQKTTQTTPSVKESGKTTAANRTSVTGKSSVSTTYENLNVKIQATQNDDGTILYRAVVTSKGGVLTEGTVILLQIENPAVGKLAELKEYTISCKDEGAVSTSGAIVYSVTSIAEVVAELNEDANNC